MARKSVLIVEGDDTQAHDLREILLSLGYEIAGTASTAEEAVEIADTKVPDLILMDIHLAGQISGIEAAETILSRHSVPIIYTAAYADTALTDQARKTRPYGTIIKPYDVRSIRTEIEIALFKFGLDQNFQKEYATLAQWVQERTEQLARANEALKKSEAKFREIFDSANDAIHLHELDGHGLPGKFIDVNEVACRMLQYSKEELLQIQPLDLVAGSPSMPLSAIGNEILTKGSVIFEAEHRKKDGNIVPVEVNSHTTVIQGTKLVVSVIRDLTRRRRDESALRAMSTELQTIIDNAPGMIWYKDTKNTFVRVNPAGARAFGLPVERIIGKNAADLFPALADRYYQDDLEIIRSKRPKLGLTEQMTTAHGETLWVQTDKIPILDEKGEVTGILLFVVDITERKITQDALALANKKLGLMASITRHDILNQLMALYAFIELCRDAATDPVMISHLQTMAKVSASIERHITFTREYQTIGEKAPEWQDVGACVYQATAALPMRNIRLSTDMPEIRVLADPLFEKIFYTLIDNALRYGGEHMTQIRITAEEGPDGLIIAVEDDGEGIAADDRPHLFSRGFGKNTGLGLFLSREILSITGMNIRETGTAGKGARFEIMAPRGSYRIRSP